MNSPQPVRAPKQLPRLVLLLCTLCAPTVLSGCARSLLSATPYMPHRSVEVALNATFDLSPDGRAIVFSGAGNGGRDLYLLELATRRVTQLTNTATFEAYPAFSPNGRSLVYQGASDLMAPRYLFLRSLDGTSVRQLTRGTSTADFSPSFSRDGQRIVFGRAHEEYRYAVNEEPWNKLDVYMVETDGTHLTRLTHNLYEGSIRPKFYPDGAHVLFEETISDANFHSTMNLSSVDVGGASDIRSVAKFGEDDYAPAFFPDGRHFVFVSDMLDHGPYSLYKMGVDGSGPTGVGPADAGTQIHNPVVSADGKTIYYLQGYGSDLWQMNLETNRASKIASGELFSDPLHWKP